MGKRYECVFFLTNLFSNSFLYMGSMISVGVFAFPQKINCSLPTSFLSIPFFCLLFLGGDLELGAGVLVLFLVLLLLLLSQGIVFSSIGSVPIGVSVCPCCFTPFPYLQRLLLCDPRKSSAP